MTAPVNDVGVPNEAQTAKLVDSLENAGSWPTAVVDRDELRAAAEYVAAEREHVPYMAVARAMVILARLTSKKAACVLTQQEFLNISRETRRAWLAPDSLSGWMEVWRSRRNAVAPVPLGLPKASKQRLTDEEWKWVARVLENEQLSSYSNKRFRIEKAASKDPARAHLMNISRSALYRARERIKLAVTEIQRERREMSALVVAGKQAAQAGAAGSNVTPAETTPIPGSAVRAVAAVRSKHHEFQGDDNSD